MAKTYIVCYDFNDDPEDKRSDELLEYFKDKKSAIPMQKSVWKFRVKHDRAEKVHDFLRKRFMDKGGNVTEDTLLVCELTENSKFS